MGFDYNSFRQQSIECLFYIAHLAQSKWYFLSILVDSGKLSVFLVSCYIDKDNKMQWEFRKAVQSFENYKRTTAFKHEIEKGEESTLDIVIRQTELMLNDPNQKIISKVLALRFIRDIMVLGQEDVIKKVEKLVPQLTKICSHQISNPDPDRGQNYFHNHPAYIKLTSAQQKKDIDTYGSTYFILALQSILHWAQWMPFDSNGQPTIYSKAYQTLLERGVTFPSTFHYYKHSDTEKFKNMYKMEFFTDSYESAYSQSRVTSQNSQLSEVQDEKNKSGWEKRKKSKNESQVLKQSVSDQYNGETQGIKSVPEMVKILTQLKESKSRKAALLKQLHKKVQQIYETDVAAGKLKVQEANWIQRYIINYSLFSSSLIDYQEFLQRCLTEEVIIEAGVQEEKINTSNFFKASPMKPLFRKETQNSKIGGQRVIQEGNKGQQFQFKNKLISLGLELEQKNNQLAIQKSNFQKEKAETIDNYETRLQAVKAEVRKTQQDKGPFQKELENENLRLKQKIATLQLQINNNGSSTSREKEIQSQRNQLLTKVKKLEIENEKLQQIRNVTKNSEKQLATMQSRIKQKESLIEKLKGELKKWQKTSQNYQDEAALYKSELINERGKHQQKINAAKKISDSLAEENTHLKEKNLQIKKILDLKEIQNMHLKQEIKRFQAKLKEQNQKNEYDNERSEGLKSKTAFQFQEIRLQSPAVYKQIASPNVAKELFSPRNNNYSQLKYKQYEDFFFELKPKNKELFLRLCRCGLKKKDILFKQNELQIGVITEVLAQNKLRFILHFTNTSEKQIENLKIDSNLGDSSYTSSLHYAIQNKYIFCIQPQQQQKVSMTITNKESPYFKQRAILQITYEKNGSSYFNHIFLPFLIPKFCDFYKPKINNLPLNPSKESLVFRYNKKMLPKSNSLKGYFQEAVQTEAGKFQMESFHRETNLNMKIVMTMGENQSLRVDFGCNTQKVNQKQQYIFEELLSFFEIAFKK